MDSVVTAAKTRVGLLKHPLFAAFMCFALVLTGCGSGGSNDDDEENAASVFNPAEYAAVPESQDISGVWMAVHDTNTEYGNFDGNNQFVAVNEIKEVFRELVTITTSGTDTMIQFCGNLPEALIIDGNHASFSYGNSRFPWEADLEIVDTSHMTLSLSSDIYEKTDSQPLYYTHYRYQRHVTMVRISDEPIDPATGIGATDMTLSVPDFPIVDHKNATVECFAETRSKNTVHREITDANERALYGKEYTRHALYIQGTEFTHWAYSDKVTRAGEMIDQRAAWVRHYGINLRDAADLSFADRDPRIIEACGRTNCPFLLELESPGVSLYVATSDLGATADEIDLATSDSPSFIRQQYQSGISSISGAFQLTDDRGQVFNASVDLAW